MKVERVENLTVQEIVILSRGGYKFCENWSLFQEKKRLAVSRKPF